MSQDIYVEARHISYAFYWGLYLALIYDAFLILRNVIKHKDIFVYIEDFIYWLFCAYYVFDNLYKIGNGYIRWYMALGVGIGMLVYKLTISKYLVQIFSYIFNKLKILIEKILYLFLKPFFKLGRDLKRIFCHMRAKRKMAIRLFKKKLTRALKMLKITLRKR